MNTVIHVKVANTFMKKLRGLMFKKECTYNLLLENCHAIHTFGMLFPIDCICIDKDNIIIATIKNINPCRIVIAPPRTKSIIECKTNKHADTLFKNGLHVDIYKDI